MSPPLLLLLPALHAADPDAYNATWTGEVPLGGDALQDRKYADPDCGELSPGQLVDLGPEGVGRCDLAVQALATAELAELRALISGVCAKAPCSARLRALGTRAGGLQLGLPSAIESPRTVRGGALASQPFGPLPTAEDLADLGPDSGAMAPTRSGWVVWFGPDLALGCTGGANSAVGTSCQLTLLSSGAPVATYAVDSYMHIEQAIVLASGRLNLEQPQPGKPTVLML